MRMKFIFLLADPALPGIFDPSINVWEVYITIVFVGNFRQTLPVIPKSSRTDIVEARLKSSGISHKIETLPLV